MGVKIEKVQPVATVQIDGPDGKTEKVENLVEPMVIDKPMANVGAKLGYTKNLGNYESLRVDISLFMPSELDQKSLDDTFDFVSTWIDLKMAAVQKEFEE